MDRRLFLQQMGVLVGGFVSGSIARAIEAGVRVGDTPVQSALGDREREMVSVVSELIIPETDTPGAIAAGVPEFIDLMVSDWYTDREREVFMKGLRELDALCTKGFRRSFLECNERQQAGALHYSEKASLRYKSKASPGFAGFGAEEDEEVPFFAKIKELTVLGYYSSEVGATQELRYNPMPMRYDGDYDFDEVGTQWSY